MVERAWNKSTSKRNGRWPDYYRATAARPPRRTLLRALDAFAREGRGTLVCVDLGCGGGRDTVEMLRRGHRVHAVDREPAALEMLRARLEPGWQARLVMVNADLTRWPLPRADVVNASFVLFTLERGPFAELLGRIRRALRPGGRFCGHLLGPEDSWVREGRCFGVTREELPRLFAGFALEWVDEEICDSTTPRGRFKHWHIWHIVARKHAAPTTEEER